MSNHFDCWLGWFNLKTIYIHHHHHHHHHGPKKALFESQPSLQYSARFVIRFSFHWISQQQFFHRAYPYPYPQRKKAIQPVARHYTDWAVLATHSSINQLINSMDLSPFWEAARRSATSELPKIYGTRKYSTVFTRALHWYLSWVRWNLSIPFYPTALSSILISPSYIWLGLPNGLFLLTFQPKSKIHSSPHACHMFIPSSLTWSF
jgi:hypothetical protein